MNNQWSSYVGFILAVAGAAIGLGNIWKFPYMVGDNGGSSFVIIYMCFVVCVGIPLMLAEILIGRCGRHNPVASFNKISKELKVGFIYSNASWIFIITSFCILSFYCVIAGLSLAYLYKSLQGVFIDIDVPKVQEIWDTLIGSPLEMVFWNGLFLSLSLWIVARGVQNGLEKANKILMPALYLILGALVFYSCSLDGFHKAIDFMFGFRLEKLNSGVIISALGHAFFSLAIGAGCLLVYGAYLPKNKKLGSSALIISVMSIIVAMMAGIAIFSITFTYDLPSIGGPGLMFEILPIAFSKMSYGYLVGNAFFLMLVFAALTSSISFIEVLVSVFEDKMTMTRKKASILIGIIAFILGLGSILSFNYFTDPIIFGRNFFYLITDISTNVLLPLGAILIAVFTGWVMPSKITSLNLDFKNKSRYMLWRFLIRWVSPICILLVMLNNIIN